MPTSSVFTSIRSVRHETLACLSRGFGGVFLYTRYQIEEYRNNGN